MGGSFLAEVNALEAAPGDEKFFHQTAVELAHKVAVQRLRRCGFGGETAAEPSHHALDQLADKVVGQRIFAVVAQMLPLADAPTVLVGHLVAPLVAIGVILVALAFFSQRTHPLPCPVCFGKQVHGLACILCVFHSFLFWAKIHLQQYNLSQKRDKKQTFFIVLLLSTYKKMRIFFLFEKK